MPLVFHHELLPKGFSLLSHYKRSECLKRTPRCLLAGVLATPAGFCLGGIDPEDDTKF